MQSPNAGDLSVFGDMIRSLLFDVLAFALSLGFTGSVGVISVGHGTLGTNKVPSVAHPTTIASEGAVGLVELFLVFFCVECAVNDLLFGEANWFLVLLDSDGALERSRGSKGPTGTARSLVLNGTHLAVESPINIDSFVRLSEVSADSAEASAGAGFIIAHLKAVNSRGTV